MVVNENLSEILVNCMIMKTAVFPGRMRVGSHLCIGPRKEHSLRVARFSRGLGLSPGTQLSWNGLHFATWQRGRGLLYDYVRLLGRRRERYVRPAGEGWHRREAWGPPGGVMMTRSMALRAGHAMCGEGRRPVGRSNEGVK